MLIERLTFYKATWAGVMRVGLWCILFLYLFGSLIPPLPDAMPLDKATEGSPLVPMLTIMDDARTVRENYLPDPNDISIAWLSDSSGVMLDHGKTFDNTPDEEYRLFATETVKRLQEKHDLKNLKVPLYLRLSSRPVDILAFALLALRYKPDIIVIPFNSVWSYSHYQIANRDKTMPLIADIFRRHPRLWPMLFSLAAPMHHLWALAGTHIDIIRYASPFKGYLKQTYAPILESALLPSAPHDIKLDVNISNIPYWIVMNMLDRDIAALHNKEGKITTTNLYHQVIQHNDPFMTESFASDAFHNMIDILQNSGVPVLIYRWPLSDTLLKEPATRKKVDELTAMLDKERERLKNSKIRIISHVPEDIRKTMEFRKSDDYHIHNEGKLDDFLAREIWLMLKEHSPKLKEKAND